MMQNLFERYLNESYFAMGLDNLSRKGLTVGFQRGLGSFLKQRFLGNGISAQFKAVSKTAERIAYEANLPISDKEIGSTGYDDNVFTLLVAIAESMRKDYGFMHGYRYKTIKDLNFKEDQTFEGSDPKRLYSGISISMSVQHGAGDMYKIAFELQMKK